tara:strand:- start:830 stop:1096 length:267 start_codon:yes stop_codon:yes gene_type:complete
MTDTTQIIGILKSSFEARGVIPAHPVLKFINYLIEDFCDEWITKYMFPFRWHKRKDINNAGPLLPLSRETTIFESNLKKKRKKLLIDK